MPIPLIIRFGALGDMVLTTPTLRALAARHGQPCAIACIGGWVRTLYQGLPYVGSVTTIASRGAPYLFSPDQWRLVATLRRFRSSPTYLLDGDQKSTWLAAHAGLTLAGSMQHDPAARQPPPDRGPGPGHRICRCRRHRRTWFHPGA
jgi:ADP-heptose:LPS heptosyltransferase